MKNLEPVYSFYSYELNYLGFGDIKTVHSMTGMKTQKPVKL